MSDLKPCPFCGGEASVVQQQESKMWTVGCLDVDCPGGWLSRDRDLLYFDKDEAVERWNSRAERTCRNLDKHYSIMFKCSECGHWECQDFDGEKMLPQTWNYCPNCGCKVVGE